MAIRGQFFPRPSRTPIRVGETRAVSPVPDIPSMYSRTLQMLVEFNRLLFLKLQTIAKYGQDNEG